MATTEPLLASSTPTTLAADSREVKPLTGLRLFAAAWVVVFHFQFTQGELLAQVLRPAYPVVTTGAMGVDLFYVLSGFVIAFTYLDKLGPRWRLRTARRFLWARVCRIWPVYVLITLSFGAFLLLKVRLGDATPAYQSVQPELSLTALLKQLAMVQIWAWPWHDGVSWVGPAWSISAEWFAYVLFPVTALLFYRLRNWSRWLLGAISVLLMLPLAALCFVTGSPYFPFSWMARILAGFTAGVLIYLVVREIPRTQAVRKAATWASWVLLAAVLTGLLLGAGLGPGPRGTERGGIVLVLFPLLIGALALAAGPAATGPAKWLSTRWAVYGGRISYSLYLIHVPVFEVYWSAMARFSMLRPDGVLSTVLTPLVFLSTFVLAHLLFRYVEEPARKRLRQLSGPRSQPAEPTASR